MGVGTVPEGSKEGHQFTSNIHILNWSKQHAPHMCVCVGGGGCSTIRIYIPQWL